MTASLKMKDLEAETGVSREAIHFYLREGLLPAPEKPKRNVAYYSDEHVVRIRAIKRLQQDQKDQYVDLDSRMLALSENRPQPAPVSGARQPVAQPALGAGFVVIAVLAQPRIQKQAEALKITRIALVELLFYLAENSLLVF